MTPTFRRNPGGPRSAQKLQNLERIPGFTASKKINAIRSVTVIKPEKGDVLKDYDVFIEGRQITGIEPTDEKVVSESLDGSGLYAIPGLINTHVHCLGFLDEDIPGLLDMGWIFKQHSKNL
jgi:cytosine/adenosine deaminase-related metal-dependent hydrolase